MMRSTLGAPLGGTMRGGHQGLESAALGLISPPNCGGGGGSCLPLTVVVVLGEPNSPVTCCAAHATGSMAANRKTVAGTTRAALLHPRLIRFPPLMLCRLEIPFRYPLPSS